MIRARKSIENIPIKTTGKYKKDWRLKLDLDENIYGVSNHVVSAIKNICPEDIFQYPAYGKLIDKLAVFYNVDAEQILLTNGCIEALNILINTFIDNDDEILTYDYLTVSSLYTPVRDIKIKPLDYSEEYKFDIKTVGNEIKENTKMVYLSSPNNITGEIIKASELEILIKHFQNVLFVIDCSYINFAYNIALEDYIDMAKNYENVAIIKSFSIDYSLAGIRLGFIYAKENIINELSKMIPLYNVNAIAIQCGCAALNDKKHIEQIKLSNSNARQLFFEGLVEKGFKPYNSEADFILCDFGEYIDFYFEKLKKNGVIVKKFEKKSQFSSCLKITIPKTGGVKYILELLNKKDVLIFDIDNVVFDIKDSCINLDEVNLLTSKEILEKLSQKYDLVAVSSKPETDIEYLLNKFEINNYFYLVAFDSDLKSESEIISDILEHCSYISIKFLGGSADSVIAGNKADIETIGVITPGSDYGVMVNNYKHLCANYILEDIRDIIVFLEKNEQN